MTRMNRSWLMRNDDGTRNKDSQKEFDLANIYLDRLQGRQDRLNAKIEAGLDIMRERADRLRPHMQMIEMFTVGRKNAAEEARQPHESIYDEFVDDPGEPESE